MLAELDPGLRAIHEENPRANTKPTQDRMLTQSIESPPAEGPVGKVKVRLPYTINPTPSQILTQSIQSPPAETQTGPVRVRLPDATGTSKKKMPFKGLNANEMAQKWNSVKHLFEDEDASPSQANAKASDRFEATRRPELDAEWSAPTVRYALPKDTGGEITRQPLAASKPLPPPVVKRVLHVWSNGFSIDDGPLYEKSNPRNSRWMESINRGKAPPELLRVNPKQKVELEIDQRGVPYSSSQAATTQNANANLVAGGGALLPSSLPARENPRLPLKENIPPARISRQLINKEDLPLNPPFQLNQSNTDNRNAPSKATSGFTAPAVATIHEQSRSRPPPQLNQQSHAPPALPHTMRLGFSISGVTTVHEEAPETQCEPISNFKHAEHRAVPRNTLSMSQPLLVDDRPGFMRNAKDLQIETKQQASAGQKAPVKQATSKEDRNGNQTAEVTSF